MSTLVLLLALALGATAPPSYAAGVAAFQRGEFEKALGLLDRAATQTSDDHLLAELQLLRAQCFAAFQKYDRAEAAFAAALEHDPEAQLDPERVLPTLVAMLDTVRKRMRGELEVDASGPGQSLWLDGAELGSAPFRGNVPIGRHHLEARDARGMTLARWEVVVGVRRPAHLAIPPPPPPAPISPAPSMALEKSATQSGAPALSLLLELRSSIAPGPVPHHLGLEAGAALAGEHWLVSVDGVAGDSPGISARAALRAPRLLFGTVGPYASADGVLFFSSPRLLGWGGAVGASYAPWRWASLFAEVGGRWFGGSDAYVGSGLLLGAGVRFRVAGEGP